MPHAAPNEPGVNACCQAEFNLLEIERRPISDGTTGQAAGVFVTYQCRVCQRKHYVHEVAPINVNASGQTI